MDLIMVVGWTIVLALDLGVWALFAWLISGLF